VIAILIARAARHAPAPPVAARRPEAPRAAAAAVHRPAGAGPRPGLSRHHRSADQRREVGRRSDPGAAPQLEAIIADNKEFPSTRAQGRGRNWSPPRPTGPRGLVGKLSRDEQQPVVVRVAAMHGADQVLSSKGGR